MIANRQCRLDLYTTPKKISSGFMCRMSLMLFLSRPESTEQARRPRRRRKPKWSCSCGSYPGTLYPLHISMSTKLSPRHRSNIPRTRLALIHEPEPGIQWRTRFTGIDIHPKTMLIRQITSPFDQHRASSPSPIIRMCPQHVQVYHSQQQRPRWPINKPTTYSNASTPP